jgi:hypothetical protein
MGEMGEGGGGAREREGGRGRESGEQEGEKDVAHDSQVLQTS